VDPRAGLDDVEKKKFLTYRKLKCASSVVQPVANRYTDCAIRLSNRKCSVENKKLLVVSLKGIVAKTNGLAVNRQW
jgi:hypothetical protein